MKELKKKIMEKLSLKALEFVNELLEEGFDTSSIKNALEDGAYLSEAGISQEIVEEVHSFLSDIEKNGILLGSKE